MIVEAGESEGVFLAEFDMEKVRAYRKRETWGNAYRRLRLYGLLTSPEVEEPFKRADATKSPILARRPTLTRMESYVPMHPALTLGADPGTAIA